MSRGQTQLRTKPNPDGGIAVIWLILYAIGLLDILVFSPSPRTELASAANHEIAVLKRAE